MAKIETINNDPLCTVDAHPIVVDGAMTTQVAIRLKHPETGQMTPIQSVSCHHSEDYQLVPNQLFYNAVGDLFTRAGITAERLPAIKDSAASHMTWNGRRLSVLFRTGVQAELNGGPVRLGVMGHNSYDGSVGTGLQFFILRSACMNQFHLGNLLGGFMLRHLKREGRDLELDLSDAVDQMVPRVQQFQELLPRFDRLTKTPLGALNGGDSFRGFLNLRQSLVNQNVWPTTHDHHLLAEFQSGATSARVGSGIRDDATTQNSLWGALNAFTAVATHDIGGFRGERVSREITESMLQYCKN